MGNRTQVRDSLSTGGVPVVLLLKSFFLPPPALLSPFQIQIISKQTLDDPHFCKSRLLCLLFLYSNTWILVEE